jgi:uncharacterized membrane protein YqjE
MTVIARTVRMIAYGGIAAAPGPVWPPCSGNRRVMGTPRLMIVIFGALALMVGVIAALTLESWWILVAVTAVFVAVSTAVVGYTLRQAGKTGGKPDPVTEARIETEGTRGDRERMHREALGS